MKKNYLAPEFENVELWNSIAIMDTENTGIKSIEQTIISDTDPETHTDEDDLDDD